MIPGCRGQMQDPEMIVNGAAVRVSAGAPFYMEFCTGYQGKPVCSRKVRRMMNNEYDQAYEDYGRMIDHLLAASDVKKAFLTKGSRGWTGKVSDEFLREGLSHLTDRQLRIIEMILFENRCVEDVCRSMDLMMSDFRSELQEMRRTLIRYI